MSYQQAFEHKLFIDFEYFYSIVPDFALFLVVFFTADALLHVNICAMHMGKSLLKRNTLKIPFFKSFECKKFMVLPETGASSWSSTNASSSKGHPRVIYFSQYLEGYFTYTN